MQREPSSFSIRKKQSGCGDCSLAREAQELKRSRYDIFAMLIRVVMIHGYCPLTRAARATNLPVDRAKKIIEILRDRGLLEEAKEEEHRAFRVTVRGSQYLELYKRLVALVGAPMPEPIVGF
jgi:predicted transcriptional regulator